MKYIVIVITLFFFNNIIAQDCKEDALTYQKEQNEKFANEVTSPLTQGDRISFKELDFYTIDNQYCVTAKLIRTPNEKPFEMATTTTRKPIYIKYGELHFILKGKKCKLDVFQNTTMARLEEYKSNLFLPFTDYTSGNGSYGGGRYIDLKIPEGDTVTINFNTAYNPYCAYNPEYSCPIPPRQNDLPVEVKAGVMKFEHK